ncbi:MAG: DUF72 domain-containing protein [Elusimicrobia bacterium]|nr:DUF72 domain-containing protein [Elusimicrobiota bacterium]
MSLLRAGCCSFPVGRASYFDALDTMEVGSFSSPLPRKAETPARWRAEAPRDFVFSVVCDPVVVENDFRQTHAVETAWERTSAVAHALDASFVVFETPATFYPQADHLRYFYEFIKRADRGGALFAWQPARGWERDLIGRVCRDLKLVHAVDPLVASPAAGTVNYFRLRGGAPGRKPSRGHRYTDAELREIQDNARGKTTYAYFATAESWQDSRRLAELTKPQLPNVRYRRPF